MDYIEILIKTAVIYVATIIVVRIMGKREVGELGVTDLIVLLLIADIAVLSLEGEGSFLQFGLAILTISVIQVLFSFISLKSIKIRNILEGKNSNIIVDGKLDIKEMQKEKYSMDDLLSQLRTQNIRSISEVKHAILETTGDLSVLKKTESEINIHPVIISGVLLKENLSILNKTEEDVLKDLKGKAINTIYFANYENGSLFIAQTLN